MSRSATTARLPAIVLSMAVLVQCGSAQPRGGTGQGVVDTPASLAGAIADPPRDRIIRLSPGQYGTLKLGPRTRGPLTIVSADPNRPAMFDAIVVNGVDGVTLRHLSVKRRDRSTINAAPYLVAITKASNVVFENNRVAGVGGTERGREHGMMIRKSRQVRVAGSDFAGTRYGIALLDDGGVAIVGNEFHGLQTDGIRGGGVDDLLIAENVFGAFTPKEKEHPDGIQLWSTGMTEAARRITIRDNLIARDGGGIVQGIFVRDTKAKLPFEELVIRDNLAVGTMYNGIAVLGVRRGAVTGNQVIAYPDMKSWIRVDRAVDTPVTGNRATTFLVGGRNAMPGGNRLVAVARQGDLRAIGEWLRARPALAARAGPYLKRLAGGQR